MKDLTSGIKIALLLMLIVFAYLVAVTFIEMPPTGEEHSKTIVGFLLGTVFSTLINFYWGNSHKEDKPTVSSIGEEAKIEVAKAEANKEIEAAKTPIINP